MSAGSDSVGILCCEFYRILVSMQITPTIQLNPSIQLNLFTVVPHSQCLETKSTVLFAQSQTNITTCMRVTSPLSATVPSAVHSDVFHKHDRLLFYLRSVHTIEPSLKPAVRSIWLSAENDTLRTPPSRHE